VNGWSGTWQGGHGDMEGAALGWSSITSRVAGGLLHRTLAMVLGGAERRRQVPGRRRRAGVGTHDTMVGHQLEGRGAGHGVGEDVDREA
jgi:hypothetical protein